MDAALRDELIVEFGKADVDKSGYIDKIELAAILNKQGTKSLTNEQFAYAFKLFDKDNDSKIHLNEFLKGFFDLFS
jgi:Ca2+-binding EF-hand superfamily protein